MVSWGLVLYFIVIPTFLFLSSVVSEGIRVETWKTTSRVDVA